MADWNKLSSRGNVEDRRGLGNTAKFGGGVSVLGIAVFMLVNYLNGGSVLDVLPQILNTQVGQRQNISTTDFDGADDYEVFTATVLGSANDMWTDVFAKNNTTYKEPKLVLFRGGTESSCGGASTEIGPHYCPVDETIYLDETFFEELQRRFGAQSGDVAQAYVIAHEVGHHVQHQLEALGGTDVTGSRTNEDSIKTELQADCYAGLWAYSIKNLEVFGPNEIVEAMDAAAAVGDDRIQKVSTGRINPESWTHGSSADRVAWFTKGYDNGTIAACDTFR